MESSSLSTGSNISPACTTASQKASPLDTSLISNSQMSSREFSHCTNDNNEESTVAKMSSGSPEILPHKDEQPLISVRDYRSCATSESESKSDGDHISFLQGRSESDLDEDKQKDSQGKQIVPHKPVCFDALVSKRSHGDEYVSRYSGGIWREDPLITELDTPNKLVFWSIDGPDEDDEDDEDNADDDDDDDASSNQKSAASKASMRKVKVQWELCNQRPGPRPLSGKMSPLQKSQFRFADCVEPDLPHNFISIEKPSYMIKICQLADALLNMNDKFVEDPSSLSESDDEEYESFQFSESSKSEQSSDIKFSLDSISDKETEANQVEDESNSGIPDIDENALNKFSSPLDETLPNQTPPDAKDVINTTSKFIDVEELLIRNDELEYQVVQYAKEKAELEAELREQKSSDKSTSSPKGLFESACRVDTGGASSPSSSNGLKRELNHQDMEKLRKELAEEKQKSALADAENKRLLGVILKLKQEMDEEHELRDARAISVKARKQNLREKAAGEGRLQRFWR